jgi:hypothetical protein
MGLNFYWTEKPPCHSCGRDFPRQHIGKSSVGWCFALHVYPEDGINGLDDWKRRFEIPGSGIFDEQHRRLTVAEMLWIITDRGFEGAVVDVDFLRINHAVRGPNGLLRTRRDGKLCIGHADNDGTWDLMIGEFQ